MITPAEMIGFLATSFQFNAVSMSVGTLAANLITPVGSSPFVILSNTGAIPGTQTTRTAALMITDGNLLVGQQWLLIVVNTVTTNAITLAGGTGVTISGTTTIAGFTGRLYTAVVNTATTMTFTGVACSWTVAGA